MRGEGGIIPVMEVNGNGGNNGGFGGFDNGWWIIIILLIFGWGRNGNWGGNSDGGSNTIPFYQSLDTDFATIERKIDGVYSGICDSTFALNNTITNGNSNIINALTQGFAGLNTGMIQQGYENRIATNGIGTQLMNCCCDLRQQIADTSCVTQRAIDGVNFNNAQNTCAITNAINNGIRDVMTNCNNNYRNLHDEIVANRIEDKNAQIQAQQNEINALRLAASQEKQNAYLVDKLNPNKCPIPAYLTCNPNAPLNYSISYGNGYGYNGGCGC